MISFRVDYVSQPIKCTPNHPFLVKGKGYIEAKDIKEDDVLAIPRTKAIKNHTHKYKVKQLFGVFNNGVEEVDLEHELTLEDYFPLGYYLGNGWCNEKKYRISFAIPHKKRDWILDCIRRTIKVSIKPGPNKNCATYETKSKKFFELFKSFGQGAFNKQIPEFIMQSSIKFKYEFIRGYLEADGYTDDKGIKKFTTVSPSLAYGLQRLLIETGRMASVQYQKRPPKTTIEGRVVNQRDTYSIALTPHGGWHGQLKSTSFDMDYAWVGIKNIEKFDFDGNVYNFGLDEEHTYLVNNIANHNCHSFFQFLPFEKNGEKFLDLALTCRSQDFLVGTVFNVMQYAVLCHMVAHLTGRKANKLFWIGNNTHIYENQVELFLNEHSDRSHIPNDDLKININSEIKNINDFKLSDVYISGYNDYLERIDYPIAV
jgi:DNA-binding CsgD family transcriptional regulator